MSKSEEKIIEILRIIDEYGKPVGAKIISKELINKGYELGERTIRYHMQILDEKGFTQKIGYAGRILTPLGKLQLKNGLIYDQVDFVFSKFEEMIYQTDLDCEAKKGNVVVNVSKLSINNKSKSKKYEESIELMQKVFSSGLSVSPCVEMHKNESDNSKNQEIIIKTICETTIDGMLLKKGIPSLPIYGGLIKIKDYIPQRFTEFISYKKTSIPPINAFIGDGMTSVVNMIETGDGIVPANFRVIAKDSLDKTKKVLNDLNKIGINGVVSIGNPGEKVLGININESMVGIAVIAGITPLCALKEMENSVDIKLNNEISSFEELTPIQNIMNSEINNRKNNKNNKNEKNDNKSPITKNILKASAKEKELKVSFLLSKAWNLIQNVDFDVETGEGSVITNLSYLKESDLEDSIKAMKKAYKASKRYLNPYYQIIKDGNGIKDYKNEKIGIATVCSLSIDGMLINKGIMSTPKYGGLLELGNNPLFTELISYDGSSVDPHEIFILKKMTSVTKSNTNKTQKYNSKDNSNIIESKKILASIKEVPFIARDKAEEFLDEIRKINLPIFKIGKPRELLYNAKVDSYNFGFVTGSGLNQIAAIRESGIDVDIRAAQKIMKINDMKTL